MLRRLHVVVTGATGNLGSRVVPALLAHPDVERVTGASRRPPPREEWGAGADYRSVDLMDADAEEQLRAVVRGADAVVHLAWRIQPSHDVGAMRAINVDGTRKLVAAIAAEDVPALVVASSLGAYGRGPKDRAVDESWPTAGIPTSAYSRQKAEVESLLDAVEQRQPELRVVRLRPALVLQAGAGAELTRYFLGPMAPVGIFHPDHLPVVPRLPRMRFQVVHTDDVAAAFTLAVTGDARGAFNLAADPVLDADVIAGAIGARVVPVPLRAARGALTLGWRTRLLPTDAGWLDMGLQTPLIDTTRAREVLGWRPEHDAVATLTETMRGIAAGSGRRSPVLAPLGTVPKRAAQTVRALLSGGIGT